jgi:hypothetical protein
VQKEKSGANQNGGAQDVHDAVKYSFALWSSVASTTDPPMAYLCICISTCCIVDRLFYIPLTRTN